MKKLLLLLIIPLILILLPGQDTDASLDAALSSPLPMGLKIAAIPTNSNCPLGWDGQDAITLGADIIFNWGLNPPIVEGVMSVPMMFGKFTGCPQPGGNVKILLGFNEWSTQGDMTKQEAAQYWHQVEECYPDYLLISPCTTRIDDLYYLRQEYRNQYGVYPRWDGIQVHPYSTSTKTSISQINGAIYRANQWNAQLGVWATEYAGWIPYYDDQVWEGMTTVIPYLQTHVTAYGWFATRYKGDEWWAPGWRTQLLDCETGTLTRLGVFYRDFGPRMYMPVVARDF